MSRHRRRRAYKERKRVRKLQAWARPLINKILERGLLALRRTVPYPTMCRSVLSPEQKEQ